MHGRLSAVVGVVASLALLSVGPCGAAAAAGGGKVATASAPKRAVAAPCARKAARRVVWRRRCGRGRAAFGQVRGGGHARYDGVLAPALGTGAGPAADGAGTAGGIDAGVGAAPQPAPSAAGDGGQAPATTSTLGVEAHDFGTFALRLTRTTVAAGNVTIYFRNHDSSEHNLWIEPPQGGASPVQVSDAVGERGGAVKTVAVSPGTWRLFCSIAGHDSMTRDLTVG